MHFFEHFTRAVDPLRLKCLVVHATVTVAPCLLSPGNRLARPRYVLLWQLNCRNLAWNSSRRTTPAVRWRCSADCRRRALQLPLRPSMPDSLLSSISQRSQDVHSAFLLAPHSGEDARPQTRWNMFRRCVVATFVSITTGSAGHSQYKGRIYCPFVPGQLPKCEWLRLRRQVEQASLVHLSWPWLLLVEWMIQFERSVHPVGCFFCLIVTA